MKRIVKFRGKQKSWIYGGACIIGNYAWIYEGDLDGDDVFVQSYAVFVETVGQFTGKYYADGREIYENDIVNGGCYNGSYTLGVIKFIGNSFVAVPIGRFTEVLSDEFEHFIYVGNTTDDPELLEFNK